MTAIKPKPAPLSRTALPIDGFIPGIVEILEKQTSLVLKAAPGSGKTTRIPPALLKAQFAAGREILVLEPRRLAAKFSAERVAAELGEAVGQTVGYRFRFENVDSAQTRLRFITEGILLRGLQSDANLGNVAAVVLDEFHERHLMTDAALAIVKTLQTTTRPDLRIVVMSATLDSTAVADFLGQARILEIPHRPHPIEIHYQSEASEKYLERQILDAVVRVTNSPNDDGGDILVFLPGMSEIRRAESALLQSLGKEGPLVFALHGQIPKSEQDQAIRKSNRRKIILSTNIAETSLTIEGVTTVIDSGLQRQATYSWWSGLPSLRTKAISRASAIQRAGRAGRTAPGRCYRLYTLGDYDSRPAFETPEIQRADLSQTWLDLKSTGLLTPDFHWFEKPAETSIESARKLLYLLGALDLSGDLTPIGRALARIPAHPRLARFVLEARRHGVLEEAAHLAALLAEGRLEHRDAIENLKSSLTAGEPQRIRLRLVQAGSHIASGALAGALSSGLKTREDRVRFSLLTAFPDRVARVRKTPASASRGNTGDQELLFSSGGSATTSGIQNGLQEGDFLLALDVQEEYRSNRPQARQIKVRCVSPLQEEWLIDLAPSLLSERDDFKWESHRERVIQNSRMTYGELVLSERGSETLPGEDAARVLIKNALGADFDAVLGCTSAEWAAFLSRVSEREAVESAFARAALLAASFPKEALTFAEEARNLRGIFLECVSTRELRERDWPFEIISARVPALAARSDQILPLAITLPSGRKAKIQYAEGKAPWVESRMQDFFGMKQAPSLLDGRLALTIHLLAPNYRAVQVTSDLAGFWKREYPELRRALSRRYPRHAWPEDPSDVLLP